MAGDVEQHCQECSKCQQSKFPTSTRSPMTNIPVGRSWQMIAADVFEVPVSFNNNRYLLVVQDYFTKWADAITIPDQKATRITRELVKLFSMVDLPDILHSDQGRNFESTILTNPCSIWFRNNHTQLPTSLGVMAWLSASIAPYCNCFDHMLTEMKMGTLSIPSTVCLPNCHTLIYWCLTFCSYVWL